MSTCTSTIQQKPGWFTRTYLRRPTPPSAQRSKTHLFQTSANVYRPVHQKRGNPLFVPEKRWKRGQHPRKTGKIPETLPDAYVASCSTLFLQKRGWFTRNLVPWPDPESAQRSQTHLFQNNAKVYHSVHQKWRNSFFLTEKHWKTATTAMYSNHL